MFILPIYKKIDKKNKTIYCTVSSGYVADMQKRKLGKSSAEISVIGLGTWAIGGPWQFGWGEQNDEESKQAVIKSIEKGVNYIDTAPAYGLGHAEKIVGEALKEIKEEVFIATKCGLVWDDKGRIRRHNKPESIRKECEDSLKRLSVDAIDLYQIHWPDPETPVEESWQEMTKLKEEGKVKHIGVSNYDANMIKECEKISHVDSSQPPFSLLKRDIETEILGLCHKNETATLAYSPMQAGLLSGSFTKEKLDSLQKDDWRRKDAFFKEPLFGQIMKKMVIFKKLAEEKNTTAGALALAWVLSKEGVTSAIVGARNENQAAENTRAAEIKISVQEQEYIQNIFDM
ncbi:MAG: aldo/keto reductase [Spirochaetia bacterium]|nr:aldo/keto reductase [Spirochaetia bacterium]